MATCLWSAPAHLRACCARVCPFRVFSMFRFNASLVRWQPRERNKVRWSHPEEAGCSRKCVNLGVCPVRPSTVAVSSAKERASPKNWHHKLRNATFAWAVVFGMRKNVSLLSSESHILHSHTHMHMHADTRTCWKSKAPKTPTHKSNV